jgi:hypothetical protein
MTFIKTNLRINSCYLVKDDDGYYLTKISKQKEWNKISDDKLSKIKKTNITSELNKLNNHFKLKSNVNYLIDVNLHKKKKKNKIKSIQITGGSRSM